LSSVIDDTMGKAVAEGVFPSASLLTSLRGEIVYQKSFGGASEQTLFDIASLTKPIATTSIALLALREKSLSLNSQAAKYLPELAGEDKGKITLRHLLKHTSGLPAWKPYFEDIAREHPELIGKRECRDVYIAKIAQEPLETPVAYQRIYSDLGFIILGVILENFLDRRLDEFFRDKIAGPLGMKDTFYAPVGEALPRPYTQFAATEDSMWRKKLIQGEVHDDNAYALGGVAGHAGLFSTVGDVHLFAKAIETAARLGHSLFPQDLLLDFIGPKVKFKLGWDTPSPEGSQSGRCFSKNSIGHLGFTGCSLWIDLEKEFHVILLTNRVHPSSKNEAIKAFRPHIHDVLYEEFAR
jgi:CubicO group peptidase (beta-lactamase class C family)